MHAESAAPRSSSLPARRLAFLATLAIAHASGGCRRDESSQFLTVFAASSLTESFQDLEATFEADHPGIDVQLAFAGSQALRVQIEQGARADVFASAAEVHMQALVQAGLVDGAEVFAHNALVVAVPERGAGEIDALADLPKAERIVLGTPEVPVGIYARELIERADATYGGGFADAVRARVVSEEANVRLVLSKVELGEADAAIVYRTDAIASGKVRAISVPEGLDVPTEYTVGIVSTTTMRETARDWLELLEGPKGRAALERRGFAIPNAP
jgi:molybdate transport system substrate-binding protein